MILIGGGGGWDWDAMKFLSNVMHSRRQSYLAGVPGGKPLIEDHGKNVTVHNESLVKLVPRWVWFLGSVCFQWKNWTGVLYDNVIHGRLFALIEWSMLYMTDPVTTHCLLSFFVINNAQGLHYGTEHLINSSTENKQKLVSSRCRLYKRFVVDGHKYADALMR